METLKIFLIKAQVILGWEGSPVLGIFLFLVDVAATGAPCDV